MAEVWDDPGAGEHVEWWFEESPVRPGIVGLRAVDGALAGTLGGSFLRMTVGGAETLVVVPLRAASLERFRGRGIFAELVSEIEERGRAGGASLGITTPNAASARTFLRHGWEVVLRPRVWVRPRRLRAVPLRDRPGTMRHGTIRIERVARFGAEVEESWRRAAASYGDAVVGDVDYLNWRFAAAPHDYRRFVATVDGRPGGYAVARRRRERGLETGMVATLVADTGAAARLLLAGLARELRGCQILAALPPRAHRGAFAAAGFVPTPRTLTILGKPLVEGARLPRNLHYGFGDHDLA